MKIEISAPKKVENISYPWLGESQHTHIVVLFHDRGCGTVLRGDGNDWRAGDYSRTWDMNGFLSFVGTITLHGE